MAITSLAFVAFMNANAGYWVIDHKENASIAVDGADDPNAIYTTPEDIYPATGVFGEVTGLYNSTYTSSGSVGFELNWIGSDTPPDEVTIKLSLGVQGEVSSGNLTTGQSREKVLKIFGPSTWIKATKSWLVTLKGGKRHLPIA